MFTRLFGGMCCIVLLGLFFAACNSNTYNSIDDPMAIKQLLEVGGRLEYGENNRVEVVDVSELDAVDDSTFDQMQSFSQLKKVYAIYTSISGKGLANLQDKTELEVLHLYGCSKIDGKNLELLVNHQRLRDVNLVGTGVSDESANVIASWHSLETLEIDGLTAKGVSVIEKALPDCEIESFLEQR